MDYDNLRRELSFITRLGYGLFPPDAIHHNGRIRRSGLKNELEETIRLLDDLNKNPTRIVSKEKAGEFAHNVEKLAEGVKSALRGYDTAVDLDLSTTYGNVISAYLDALVPALPRGTFEAIEGTSAYIIHPGDPKDKNRIAYWDALEASYAAGFNTRFNDHKRKERKAAEELSGFMVC